MSKPLINRYNAVVRQGDGPMHRGRILSYRQPERFYRELVLEDGRRFGIVSWTPAGELTTTSGERWDLCGGKEVQLPQFLDTEEWLAGLKR